MQPNPRSRRNKFEVPARASARPDLDGFFKLQNRIASDLRRVFAPGTKPVDNRDRGAVRAA